MKERKCLATAGKNKGDDSYSLQPSIRYVLLCLDLALLLTSHVSVLSLMLRFATHTALLHLKPLPKAICVQETNPIRCVEHVACLSACWNIAL
jgi:hypothetical protein